MNLKKLVLYNEQQQDPVEDARDTSNQLQLLESIELLVSAKTPQQVTQVGQTLTKLDLTNPSWYNTTYSTPEVHTQVLERIIKATAMTGLTHIALNISDHLLNRHHNPHVPSMIAQDAICRTLRKGGQIPQMEQFLLKVGRVAVAVNVTNTTTTTSQISYNMFLAALCDAVVDKSTDRSFWAPINPRKNLQQAVSWLDTSKTTALLGLQPNSVSYTTVLNAASEYGNTTMANQIWDMAQQAAAAAATLQSDVKLQFKISFYNARLKSLVKQQPQEDDESILQLWQQMQKKEPLIKPDRYTIDLLLLPLLRAGRIGEIEKLLDQFVMSSHQSNDLVADAFEAFLWTIVSEGNDVATARAIFDMYVAPSLAPVLNYDDAGATPIRLVKARTRHFTTVIEGYRKQLEEINENNNMIINSTAMVTTTASTINATATSNKGFLGEQQQPPGCSNVDGDDVKAGLCQEAWKLYRLMLTSPKTQPDEYTITTMMGICQSSDELTTLLDQALNQIGLDFSSGAVLRAAITKYGDLQDPSSACALFAAMVVESPISTRYWNVLLGALTKQKPPLPVAINNTTYGPLPTTTTTNLLLDVYNAQVNRIFQQTNNTANNAAKTNSKDDVPSMLPQLLDGMSCWEAVQMLVNDYIEEPTSQTYCLLAKAAQNNNNNNNNNNNAAELALSIFRNATAAGIPADGRFINAVIRCFGNDIDAAIKGWKTEIGPACLLHENRPRSKPVSPSRTKGKNLLAAYHGLLFVSGRAQRPDISLRLVYAMSKEGLEPDETALNCYNAGKRLAQQLGDTRQSSRGVGQRLDKLLNMVDAYESLLFVECVKYDQRDKRRLKDKRIRIIL